MQDVQQEQEFAKWWEQESKRVQMELEGFSQNRQNRQSIASNGNVNELNGHSREIGQNAQRGRGGKLRRGRKKSVP